MVLKTLPPSSAKPYWFTSAWQTMQFPFFWASQQELDVLKYPKKAYRYLRFGINHHYQYCYTDEEVELLKAIQNQYGVVEDQSKANPFELDTDKRFYNWWSCQRPKANFTAHPSFTLPSRESKDMIKYPLWQEADNLARQIANWQASRFKNQNSELMNDPTMLALEELKTWLFNELSGVECTHASLEKLIKRESYIKNLVHIIPTFGPDKLYLHDIANRLHHISKGLTQCIAEKKLPDLLSDIIIKTKSLETNLASYLHFLLINEPVADNFADEFITAYPKNCHLSPLCKSYQAALESSTKNEIASPFLNRNPFYHLTETRNEGQTFIQLSLKKESLAKIKFADFVTPQDKDRYLATLALLDSLSQIRQLFSHFKEIQTAIGTYIFANFYQKKTNQLAASFIALVDQAQGLMTSLIDTANGGLGELLSGSPQQQKSNQCFEDNLKALDTQYAKGTTTAEQLISYCQRAKASVQAYETEMSKLDAELQLGLAQKEIAAGMEKLVNQINYMNAFVDAQLSTGTLHLPEPSANQLANYETNPPAAEKNAEYSPVGDKLESRALASLGYQLKPIHKSITSWQWQTKVRHDPISSQPIYIYILSLDKKEQGRLEFFGQPMLCAYPEGNKHNIVSMTGIFKGIKLPPQGTIDEICAVLPPSLFDKVIFATKNAVGHGLLRGSTKVLALTLRTHGWPNKTVIPIKGITYYGALFAMQFQQFFKQSQNEDQLKQIVMSLQQAAYATGNIWIINQTLHFISHLLDLTKQNVKDKGWERLSMSFDYLSRIARFGIFARDIKDQGLVATAASLAAGTATEVATEQAGSYFLSRNKI
ncbi:MAG: hypothetical protein H0W64_12560 [Gammaproteobacteria bacterium]|nr:hypothetical protein [Gammaproteobacteria bacterium]